MLTSGPGGESIWMPIAELGLIGACHVGQRDTQRVGDDRETPERVAELLDHRGTVQCSLLHHMLAYESQHLTGFLREAGCRVEQALLVAQRRIYGPRCSMLIVVEADRVAQL